MAATKALLIIGLALKLHLHHHFHGPPLDYVTLAVGAFASWIGVPGPGEPLLIAAGVLAAQHKLDISEVLLVAWISATVGGVGGGGGNEGGRRILTVRGPLFAFRERALARGEEAFNRFPRTAVLLTPTWIAGINNVPPAVYLPWNAVGAALWACAIGIGAYLVGPAVVDAVNDAGLVGPIAVVALIVVGIAIDLIRRWRQLRR